MTPTPLKINPLTYQPINLLMHDKITENEQTDRKTTDRKSPKKDKINRRNSKHTWVYRISLFSAPDACEIGKWYCSFTL